MRCWCAIALIPLFAGFVVCKAEVPEGQLVPIGPPGKQAYLPNIDQVDASPEPLYTLDGIGNLTRVRSLTLICHPFADLAPLADLSSLSELTIAYTNVATLVPIRDLRLRFLHIRGTEVSDLEPLAGMTTLEELYISETRISDVNVLATLPKLEYLFATHTRLRDIRRLPPRLKTLVLSEPLSAAAMEHIRREYPGVNVEIVSEPRAQPCKRRSLK